MLCGEKTKGKGKQMKYANALADSKQNIMLLIPSLQVGGTERSVSNLSQILQKQYHVFLTVFHTQGLAQTYGGFLVCLQCPHVKNIPKRALGVLRRIKTLRRAARHNAIDIVVGFTGVGAFYTACLSPRYVRVVSSRGFEDVVQWERRLLWMLRRNRCEHILFNSEEAMQWFAQRNSQYAAKVTAIPNGFDFDAIAKLAAEPVEKAFEDFAHGRDVVISVGRAQDVKRLDYLIKAFLLLQKRRENACLVIVGDGPQLPVLSALVEKAGAQEDIFLMGERQNPLPLVKRSKLYVLPSRAEGFPNALIEAMACGTPVICANCKTGPNEILHDAYVKDLDIQDVYHAPYGVLVPPVQQPADDMPAHTERAHEILASAMQEMLSDEALRNRYRVRARMRIEQFSYEAVQAKYFAWIETLGDGGSAHHA